MTFNDDFKVPLSTFLSKIKNTSDEVWSRLLQVRFGTQKHTELGWSRLLDSIRKERV